MRLKTNLAVLLRAKFLLLSLFLSLFGFPIGRDILLFHRLIELIDELLGPIEGNLYSFVVREAASIKSSFL